MKTKEAPEVEKQTVSIHGKNYELVASRVHRFREKEPQLSITTNIHSIGNGEIIMRAEIKDDKGVVLATGHAHEHEGANTINKTSYVEVAETSAIGRALACFDYQGGEFASADEVVNAINQQKDNTKEFSIEDKIPFGKYKGESWHVIALKDDDYLKWLADNSKSADIRKKAETTIKTCIDEIILPEARIDPDSKELPPVSSPQQKESRVEGILPPQVKRVLELKEMKDVEDAVFMETLQKSYGVDGKTVEDLVNDLDQAQAEHLISRLKKA